MAGGASGNKRLNFNLAAASLCVCFEEVVKTTARECVLRTATYHSVRYCTILLQKRFDYRSVDVLDMAVVSELIQLRLPVHVDIVRKVSR